MGQLTEDEGKSEAEQGAEFSAEGCGHDQTDYPAIIILLHSGVTLVSMIRAILVILLVAAAAVVALWQFDVIDLPFGQGTAGAENAVPDLFQAVRDGDVPAAEAAIAAGTPVSLTDAEGRTALMLAASGDAPASMLTAILNAGAPVNARAPDGSTALLLAAQETRDANKVLLLMNAGADPTVRNNAGESAAQLAARNASVNATTVLVRLQELEDSEFNPDWPSGYVVPVAGATISSRVSHLPGALRAYRNGRHEGFDFYSGTVSVPITYGTPIQAVAGGTVIRADTDYVEMTQAEYDAVIAASVDSLGTPPEMLDRLRGMQVWIEHAGGFVSRYAHLSAIEPGIVAGASVTPGQTIAATGNSGTLEAAMQTEDDPHPHVEIWKDNTYLGAGMEPDQIYDLAGQVFGRSAVPVIRE